MKNSAEVLAHLTKDCVHLLQVSGLNVITLVFDGTYANQNTAKILGCKVNRECKKTSFIIPQNPSSRVHIIFDICHMLKLVRNMFGDMGTLQVDEKGVTQPISWKYIDALNDVQENLRLSMANKLTKKHLLWVKNKMKVKLAAQILSASVATAIDFLREEAKIPEFQGSAPTTKFIKVVDCEFDMLNS